MIIDNEQNIKPCPRCLLSETSQAQFYQNVKQYVDAIAPEEKAPEEEYQRRLDICKTCNHLMSGMCGLCGCYVEVRAAKIAQKCVSSVGAW